MIAYQSIGNNGRIGNQLFQIASTIGIAIENGHDFVFNDSEIFKHLPNLKKYTTITHKQIINRETGKRGIKRKYHSILNSINKDIKFLQ